MHILLREITWQSGYLQNQHWVLKLWHGALIFMVGGQGSWQAIGFTQLLWDFSDMRDVNYRKYCLLDLTLKCLTSIYSRSQCHVDFGKLDWLFRQCCFWDGVHVFYKNLYAAVSKILSWFDFFNCILLYMGIEFVRLRT